MSNQVDEEGALGRAAAYARSCRVDDGGYFFARIPPGSLLDTWYAVAILHALGLAPERPEALEAFLEARLANTRPGDSHAAYLLAGIADRLHTASGLNARIARLVPASGPAPLSRPDSLYVEVNSELRRDYEYLSLLGTLGLPLPQTGLADGVRLLSNADGGYGRQGSTLATTACALATLRLLGAALPEPERTAAFLDARENRVYYLEDLYDLTRARAALGQPPRQPEARRSFVLSCQRRGGGFARAAAMGIPTLEYTFYAVTVLGFLTLPEEPGGS